MNIKIAIAALFCACALTDGSLYADNNTPSPKDWVKMPSEAVLAIPSKEIAESDFYIVGLTHVFTAVALLDKTSIKELTPEEAKDLTGHYYRQPIGKKAFLVRGLFANETGNHKLELHGDSLVVTHGSLGHSFEPHFSPIILLLEKPPKDIYVVIAGAH